MLRNRIHRLLGAQHEVKLPQCSDLFGRKGLSFLDKLELPAPAKLLLTQQLALLKQLAVRIHEDEQALEGLVQETPALNYVRSLPGMGQSWPPWSSARSTASSASPRLRSFVATPACVHPPTAAGAKFFKANCYDIATNGSAGPSSRPPGLPSVARPTSGTSIKRKRALGKKPSLTIMATARLIARITWQLSKRESRKNTPTSSRS